jgi:hypothetical protein
VPFIITLAAFFLGYVAFSLMERDVTSTNAARTPFTRQANQSELPKNGTPVVVELFTSEGCSTCPPADKLLAALEDKQPVPGAEVIALEEHVDYWNSQGWNDPFSSVEFTNRQNDYEHSLHASTAFTPQMVVDGMAQFVGSNAKAALAAIAKATESSTGHVDLQLKSDPVSNTVPVNVHFASDSKWPPRGSADVMMAITEDGLSSNVTRGENAGTVLNHQGVVRELRVVGHVGSEGTFAGQPNVKISKGWNRAHLRVVVFVQMRSDDHIVAAAAIPLQS